MTDIKGEHSLTVEDFFSFFQITLLDVNDNSPMFSMQRQDMFIPESVPINTTFYLPVAEDRDSQQFGVASYELEAHTQGWSIEL